jgi:hypothetical protein
MFTNTYILVLAAVPALVLGQDPTRTLSLTLVPISSGGMYLIPSDTFSGARACLQFYVSLRTARMPRTKLNLLQYQAARKLP